MSKVILTLIVSVLITGCTHVTVQPAPMCTPIEMSYGSPSYDYSAPYTYFDYGTSYYSPSYGME